MRLGLTNKAEEQFKELMVEAGITNPTHLLNLFINYIHTSHKEEAVNYARNKERDKTKA